MVIEVFEFELVFQNKLKQWSNVGFKQVRHEIDSDNCNQKPKMKLNINKNLLMSCIDEQQAVEITFVSFLSLVCQKNLSDVLC